MQCPKCKNTFDDNVEKCPVCGYPMKAPQISNYLIRVPAIIGVISIALAIIVLLVSITADSGILGNLHAVIYAIALGTAGYFNVNVKKSIDNQKIASAIHGIACLILMIESAKGLIDPSIVVLQAILLVINIVCMNNAYKEISSSKLGGGNIKLCKYCRSAINKEAKVCPICKRKQQNVLLTIFKIYLTICIFFFAVGVLTNDDDNSEPNKSAYKQENVDNQKKVNKPKVDEKVDDNTIDVDIQDCHVKYVSHEVTLNAADTKCVAVYYEFTNNSSENETFGYYTDAKAFQNGVELEDSLFYTENDDKTTFAEIKPGTTTTVCMAYELRDDSEVTLEITKYFRDKVEDSMTIQVK